MWTHDKDDSCSFSAGHQLSRSVVCSSSRQSSLLFWGAGCEGVRVMMRPCVMPWCHGALVTHIIWERITGLLSCHRSPPLHFPIIPVMPIYISNCWHFQNYLPVFVWWKKYAPEVHHQNYIDIFHQVPVSSFLPSQTSAWHPYLVYFGNSEMVKW